MNNKYYCRSIREDGYGECVVPELVIPDFHSLFYGKARKHDAAIKEWNDHLSSLPVAALVKEGKIGWLEGYEERYEVLDRGYEWVDAGIIQFEETLYKRRRIILVPKEDLQTEEQIVEKLKTVINKMESNNEKESKMSKSEKAHNLDELKSEGAMQYCEWCKCETFQIAETTGARCQKCGNQNPFFHCSQTDFERYMVDMIRRHDWRDISDIKKHFDKEREEMREFIDSKFPKEDLVTSLREEEGIENIIASHIYQSLRVADLFPAQDAVDKRKIIEEMERVLITYHLSGDFNRIIV